MLVITCSVLNYWDSSVVEASLSAVELVVVVLSLLLAEAESLVDSVLMVMSNEPAQFIGFSGADGE